MHNQQDCVDFKEKKVYNKLTRIQYRITTNYQLLEWRRLFMDNIGFIVSMASYSKRIETIHICLDSLFSQTRKPQKIILYLDESVDVNHLPNNIIPFIAKGLEIVQVSSKLKAHNKYFYVFSEYANTIIITVDDDLIYNVDMVERLVGAYIDDPSYIYCCRMHKMRLKKNGLLEGYMAWDWETSLLDASPLNFPTGCGGVLYPPHCFNDEVFNENVFLNICKFADDVWFKAMSLYNGVQSKRIVTRNSKGKEYIENMEVQDVGLYHINNNKTVNRNDIQLKAVFDKYNLYALL